ncbi:MAG: sigma-70 family RNA polymerase sigma factor [Planctomycetes bacterium]|nr:sigma-70 family RNA polymerase sigma factor [Planctomycetota bacterium]
MVSNSLLRGARRRGAAASVGEAALDVAAPAAAAGDEGARVGGAGSRRGEGEPGEVLLRRYHQRRSKALFDRVVERHRPDVEALALGLAARLPRSVDVQDLLHAGMWGLMQAVAAFAPDRGESWSAFMRIRVRGAMLDELRHLDFLPRLLRRRLRERDAVRGRLCMELEREPTDSELAAALGITEAALLRRWEPAMLRPARGDDDVDEEFPQLPADQESPIDVITRQELIEQIRNSLSKIEWRVLQLHYLEGMTGRQVARRLRLSASRICQIHGQVLDRLKQQLQPTAV